MAAVSLGGVVPAMAQVSPGPLSKAHASLEGSLNCFQCHGSRSDPMESRCLACHEGVAWLSTRGRGLHGRSDLSECARCHPEHAGAGFDLIQWEEGSPGKFEHARAGWPLEGRHAALRCAQCHQERFRVSRAAELSPRKSDAPTWIGLETACGSCHRDIHRGSLGAECSSCHTAAGWKPARAFDHGRTSFPLTGLHAGVQCDRCHQAPGLDLAVDDRGRKIPLYKPLPHQECSSCHRDPHQGRLGEDCSRCHTTEGFGTLVTAAFDHGRTRYPLRGAHRRASCESCHRSGEARVARPAFGTCGVCHADPHAGKATVAGRSADCSACHEVDGWARSSFTLEQHAASDYPLEGRHASVKCGSCHIREADPSRRAPLGSAGVRLRPAHEHCMDCHADAHGGQLGARAGGAACEGCHTVEGWKPSRFTAEDHLSLSVSLEGGHRQAACSSCHGPDRPGLPPLPGRSALGSAGIALALEERFCADCHADPHQGRYASPAPGGAATPGSPACLRCHSLEAFRPSTLDAAAHSRFGFAIEGAHRAVACLDCHEELRAAPPESTLIGAAKEGRHLLFQQERSRCRDCHQGPHGEQFAGHRDEGCPTCHTVDAWSPAGRFDHDRDAAFVLKGSHSRVPCAGCHPVRKEGDRARVTYRPLPSRCEDCHAPGTAGTERPPA